MLPVSRVSFFSPLLSMSAQANIDPLLSSKKRVLQSQCLEVEAEKGPRAEDFPNTRGLLFAD